MNCIVRVFLFSAMLFCGCTDHSADTSSSILQLEADTSAYRPLKNYNLPATDEQRPEGAVEQMPVFPGGEEALMIYLKKHIRYPKSAIADSATGLVYTSFVVDENGKISDIRILRSADERFNEPTIEVLRNMPAWEPGLHRGQKVSVRYNLPVRYQLQNESGTGHSNE